LFPAGKAAKYIGKLGFKLARNFGSDDPKPLSSGRTFEEDASSGNEGKKAHHLRALVAGHDGSVWVGFKAGRIERFRFNAKLLWSKVCLSVMTLALLHRTLVALSELGARLMREKHCSMSASHALLISCRISCGPCSKCASHCLRISCKNQAWVLHSASVRLIAC